MSVSAWEITKWARSIAQLSGKGLFPYRRPYEAPLLELQAGFGGGLAVENSADFLLQIVAFRDAHFRISNGSLPSSPSVSLEPIKSWWNRPTRLATGRRSYSKTWGIDFVGENWVRLAKFGIQSEIIREYIIQSTTFRCRAIATEADPRGPLRRCRYRTDTAPLTLSAQD